MLTTPGPLRGLLRPRIAALFGVIVLLLAAGIWVAFTHSTAEATNGNGGKPAAGGSAPAAKPLHVIAITPTPGSRGVDGVSPIKVQFSAQVAKNSALPVVKPRIRGTWQGLGTKTLEFVPKRGFDEYTRVRIQIPAGSAGVRAVNGGEIATPQKAKYVVGHYQPIRMAELLAQLGYLPLTWQQTSGTAVPLSDPQAQLSAAFQAPAGSFTWKPGYPYILHTFWQGGSPAGLIMDGAIRAFEAAHGLTMDGVAGKQVWKAMFEALAKDQRNHLGYTYALADQHLPETLTVWHNGHIILHSPANTGIAAAPTTVGTAPVYLRYRFQIMRGTNPDGSTYADPVNWVSYFRAGEAVHYFPRASYGFNQSLGCVELPWGPAKKIWPYMNYGTLVTVTAP